LTDQLGLFDAKPPKAWRASALRSLHVRHLNLQADEALVADQRAQSQEEKLLTYFQDNPGARLTRHDVHQLLGFHVSSAGRSLSNLAKRGYLRKVKSEHRAGEGATCHPYEMVEDRP